MKRRDFLKSAALASVMTNEIARAATIQDHSRTDHSKGGKVVVRIGICADLHQDIIPDGPRRLQAFITEMNVLKPDLIVQMGDFCVPKPGNQMIMDIWNQFGGPKYHVIGNHDTDGGFTHDQVVSFWNAKDKYYSFDQNGYHFVVLNANEEKSIPNYNGPSGVISEAQNNWLEKDITDTRLPVIVFCHQGIDNNGVNRDNLVRVIFDRANVNAGFKKVQFVFSGHHHQDYYNVINGVHFVQINSMSYQWMGANYAKPRYEEAIERAYPGSKYTAPYKDPIWAFLTIYSNGIVEIKGKKSSFLPPTPEEMHRPQFHGGYPDVPYISDRKIKI